MVSIISFSFLTAKTLSFFAKVAEVYCFNMVTFFLALSALFFCFFAVKY